MRRITRALSYVAVAMAAGAGGAAIAIALTGADDEGEMPGYRLTSQQQTFVRVFDDGTPQVIHDFPATMNGCAQGRFVVRWRTLNPDITVTFTPVYGGRPPDDPRPVEDAQSETGSSGEWVSNSQCEQPSWTLAEVGDSSATLTDVTVEYEVWAAAP